MHLKKAENECKFWLEPVKLSKNYGFSSKALKKIEQIITDHLDYLVEKYHEFHKR